MVFCFDKQTLHRTHLCLTKNLTTGGRISLGKYCLRTQMTFSQFSVKSLNKTSKRLNRFKHL